MALSALTFKILFLFFPGILCTKILDLFVKDKVKHTKLEWIINSFLLGVISHLIALFSCFIFSKFKSGYLSISYDLKIFNDVNNFNMSISYLIITTIIAIMLACLISRIMSNDSLYKWAITHKLTINSGRDSVLKDIYSFIDPEMTELQNSWVRIRRYADDISYIGYITYFNLNNNKLEVLLHDVDFYYNNNEIPSYSEKAVYLNVSIEDIYIEYLS